MSPQSTDPLNPNSTISFNAGGEKVISTPQPDGSTLVVTMGGGSDGNEKPYTKTEIIPPPKSGVPAPAPVLDYTNKPIQTGQWKNDDGTTTNSLLTRSGTALETTGGGSDANDKPWKVTQEINPLTHSLITSVDTGGKLITDDGFGTITLTENIGNGIHRVTTQHGGLDGAEKPWQDVLVTDGKGNATLSHTVGGITDSTMTNKAGNLVQKTHIDWDGTVSTTAYVGNQPLNTVTTTKNAIGEPTVITTDPSGYVIDSYVIPPEIPATGLLDGFKHSGQVAVDLANNLIWQPIKQNFLPHPFGAPDDTTRSATDWNFPYVPPVKDLRPWPSALDLGLAVLDASVFASLPGLLVRGAASLAERVGATLAARAASRNALAAGATTEEAAAASSNAIRDYIVSHEAGDTAYGRALADGQDKQIAEALRQQAINDSLVQQQAFRDGLNPLDIPPTGERPTASGPGSRGDGLNRPEPGMNGLTNRNLPGRESDPNMSDPRPSPNNAGAQPNTSGLNSTPLDLLLDGIRKDLGVTWEDGQYQFDQFIANSRADLDVVLDEILEQEPALADVVGGVKSAEIRLGLGGDARGAGGAAGRGDIETPSGGGGRGHGGGTGTGPTGRGPGGRGPTGPPDPPIGGDGGAPLGDYPEPSMRYLVLRIDRMRRAPMSYEDIIDEIRASKVSEKKISDDQIAAVIEMTDNTPKGLLKTGQTMGVDGKIRVNGGAKPAPAEELPLGRQPTTTDSLDKPSAAQNNQTKLDTKPTGDQRTGMVDLTGDKSPWKTSSLSGKGNVSAIGGDIGEGLTRAKLIDDGFNIIAEGSEASIEVPGHPGKYFEPDFIVEKDGKIFFVESKWKGGGYTPNQIPGYGAYKEGNLRLNIGDDGSDILRQRLERLGISEDVEVSGVTTYVWNDGWGPTDKVVWRAANDRPPGSLTTNGDKKWREELAAWAETNAEAARRARAANDAVGALYFQIRSDALDSVGLLPPSDLAVGKALVSAMDDFTKYSGEILGVSPEVLGGAPKVMGLPKVFGFVSMAGMTTEVPDLLAPLNAALAGMSASDRNGSSVKDVNQSLTLHVSIPGAGENSSRSADQLSLMAFLGRR
ncbi:hypothetical protein [Nocardia sp. NPDC056100]|uniref:hypothetical protein n=1 Tax=Nocardia sp. NPDC056100 TaxID=3345712 RepID=UPI0035E19331